MTLANSNHTIAPIPVRTAGLADDGVSRDMRVGWAIVLVFFGLFLGWAVFVRMDAAASAQGLIAVSGNREIVQHREGGTIARIAVEEGQRVQQGEVLVVLAGGDAEAAERSLASQFISLQMERARLRAEFSGSTSIAMPGELANLNGADRQEAEEALALQRDLLSTRRAELAGQKSLLAQQSAQMSAKITGIQGQIQANRQQSKLLGDELAGLQSLADRGFVSKNRLRAIQRSDAALSGDTANLASSVAATREQMDETRTQMLLISSQANKSVAEDLRNVESSLNDIRPKLAAAKAQLARSSIRAPVSGQVIGLKTLSLGSVIGPGETVMEIVPEQAGLIVQARLSPTDARDLRIGQTVEIRISGSSDRSLPLLLGRLTKLSADSLVDQRTAQRYFAAEVKADRSALTKLGAGAGEASIKAGIPVDVIFPTRKRTLFQYLTEPLAGTLDHSFRER